MGVGGLISMHAYSLAQTEAWRLLLLELGVGGMGKQAKTPSKPKESALAKRARKADNSAASADQPSAHGDPQVHHALVGIRLHVTQHCTMIILQANSYDRSSVEHYDDQW